MVIYQTLSGYKKHAWRLHGFDSRAGYYACCESQALKLLLIYGIPGWLAAEQGQFSRFDSGQG